MAAIYDCFDMPTPIAAFLPSFLVFELHYGCYRWHYDWKCPEPLIALNSNQKVLIISIPLNLSQDIKYYMMTLQTPKPTSIEAKTEAFFKTVEAGDMALFEII